VRDENGEWETADPAEQDFLSDKQNEEPNGAPACGFDIEAGQQRMDRTKNGLR
jgi:hypothetical protein